MVSGTTLPLYYQTISQGAGEGDMRVKTKVKSGKIVDSAKAAVQKTAGSLKNTWDKLPNWLTWPW
jgi:hypothetical protein